MPYAPTTWVDGVTKLGPTNLNKLEQGLLSAASVGDAKQPRASYSATPPASPVDGDEWIFPADATAGVMWRFRYNAASASAYKWEFIGGSELSSNIIVANESTTTAATWVNLTTVGPLLTVSRSGEYRVEAKATTWKTTADPNVQLGVNVGDFANPGLGLSQVANVPVANYINYIQFIGGPVAFASGDVLRMKHFQSVAGTLTAQFRQFWIRPVRVA